MKNGLIILILTSLFASSVLAAGDIMTCKTADEAKQVTIWKLALRKFRTNVSIGAPGTRRTFVEIQSDVRALGPKDGNVYLDPAPGQSDGLWLMTLTNQAGRVTLNLKVQDADLYDRTRRLGVEPDTLFYCDIEDVKELLN